MGTETFKKLSRESVPGKSDGEITVQPQTMLRLGGGGELLSWMSSTCCRVAKREEVRRCLLAC